MIQQSTADLSMPKEAKTQDRDNDATVPNPSGFSDLVNLPTLIYLVYTTQSCTMFHEHLTIREMHTSGNTCPNLELAKRSVSVYHMSDLTRYTTEDWRGKGRETSTASPLVAFAEAICSRRFHMASCFNLTSFSLVFSSSYFRWHSLNSPASWSENSFRTFRVRLWTAGFQCPLVFLSNAGKIIGNITLLFCLIKLSIWSLFHKNNARSATWNQSNCR